MTVWVFCILHVLCRCMPVKETAGDRLYNHLFITSFRDEMIRAFKHRIRRAWTDEKRDTRWFYSIFYSCIPYTVVMIFNPCNLDNDLRVGKVSSARMRKTGCAPHRYSMSIKGECVFIIISIGIERMLPESVGTIIIWESPSFPFLPFFHLVFVIPLESNTLFLRANDEEYMILLTIKLWICIIK